MKYSQMACFRSEWILIEQRELGQILIEIEVDLTWRGIRHLSVDVFMIEQSVLEQVLVEIDIEVGVGLTWRGMVIIGPGVSTGAPNRITRIIESE